MTEINVEPAHESEETLVTESHIGVKTVQATHKVYGKYSKWFLFLG
jgi:hypothetical protein